MKTQKELRDLLQQIIEHAAPNLVPHTVSYGSDWDLPMRGYISATLYRDRIADPLDRSVLAIVRLKPDLSFRVTGIKTEGLLLEHSVQAQMYLRASHRKVCGVVVHTIDGIEFDAEKGAFVRTDPTNLEWHELKENGLYWKVFKSDPQVYSMVEYDNGTLGYVGCEVWEDLVLNNFGDDWFFVRVAVPEFKWGSE